ncbi:MAG: hypothetical protein JSU86_04875 [Phycisphaerales bacterium]|nr:MAG: hypothetical protein JSU86_04875 [Phycisphaerales bacterium]
MPGPRDADELEDYSSSTVAETETLTMTLAGLREPKLDTIRELNRIEQLAGETREVIKGIDADGGEPIFLTINAAITDAIGTIQGVLAAYRYQPKG